MMYVRTSEARGHAEHGWLDTHHTFSFADYYDPDFMGFRTLRVINEDTVAPRRGFGKHPHRDMEILTYVVSGAVEHEDSMGTRATIRPGEVQRMSAGTGVVHSEMNPLDAPLHLLQIWLLPDRQGLPPGYEQKHFAPEERQGRLRVVASHDGRDGSLTVHQDVVLSATELGVGQRVEYALQPGRHAWLQVIRGEATLNGVALKAGDGVAVSEETALALEARTPTEALLFDLS
ncbi:pirin family protein [Corallococcus exercitus]|uniref:Pirin family protein n=1 Tax=Corallococcus exercitus TaxID=2316736 RepID=A0A7Y4KPX1_9BACT|nr:pirin family protein [Corallococcus exercitus]NOK37786.1 pirin family protein [Corallococcus exercitus]